MYEGVPNYPDWGHLDVVEKHQVNITLLQQRFEQLQRR